MKNLILIPLLLTLISSCNTPKKPKEKNVFEDIYMFKGPVKKIEQKIVYNDFYFFSVTTFDRDGTPIETINYDKKGNATIDEPWTKLNEEELNDQKTKKVFDNQKRLIKQIEYSSLQDSTQIEYQYSKNGKKIKEIKTFADRNIQSKFNVNELLEEVRMFVVEDGQLYQQSKEEYFYNKKLELIKKHLYRYDENEISAKKLYEYDNIGSLIKISTYYTNSKIPEIDNRKITYY